MIATYVIPLLPFVTIVVGAFCLLLVCKLLGMLASTVLIGNLLIFSLLLGAGCYILIQTFLPFVTEMIYG